MGQVSELPDLRRACHYLARVFRQLSDEHRQALLDLLSQHGDAFLEHAL